eukprot:jgi/Ulvmu1/9788/UM056_0028.1
MLLWSDVHTTFMVMERSHAAPNKPHYHLTQLDPGSHQHTLKVKLVLWMPGRAHYTHHLTTALNLSWLLIHLRESTRVVGGRPTTRLARICAAGRGLAAGFVCHTELIH